MEQPEFTVGGLNTTMDKEVVDIWSILEDVSGRLTPTGESAFNGCRLQSELITDEQILPGSISQFELEEGEPFINNDENLCKLVTGPECLDILQAQSASLADPVLDQILSSAFNQTHDGGSMTSSVVADDVVDPTLCGTTGISDESRDRSVCTCARRQSSPLNKWQQDWSRDVSVSRQSHNGGKHKRSSEAEIEKEIKRRQKTLPKRVPLTDQERERMERRKQQNRDAATRCRQKKRVSHDKMIEEEKQLSEEHSTLEKEIAKLQSELLKMKTILSNHHCVMANRYH